MVEQDLRNKQKRRQKDEENGDTGQKGQMQDMYIDKDRAIGKIWYPNWNYTKLSFVHDFLENPKTNFDENLHVA